MRKPPACTRLTPLRLHAGEEVARVVETTGNDYYEDELPRHRVYLDAYQVARFPTTNGMYARFVADGGYREARWWAEAIGDERWARGKIRDYEGRRDVPAYWLDGRLNNPAQPVVGVNWYEAAAYCRWLTAQLDDGHVYRLPTEAEWERAARGPDGRRYPWGDEWSEGLRNCEQAGLGVTSPVGSSPGRGPGRDRGAGRKRVGVVRRLVRQGGV